ncbi:hypothetical protein Tco_1338984 [Tanacetum coccineum]
MENNNNNNNSLSLRSILKKDKLIAPNFREWERNLYIVLRHELTMSLRILLVQHPWLTPRVSLLQVWKKGHWSRTCPNGPAKKDKENNAKTSGKENGVNILKSIDEGPFQMGTFWETLAKGTEGALHLGPERPRVYSDLSPEDKERIEDRGTMHGVQVQLVMGELKTELGMLIQVKQGRLSVTTATDLALNVDNVFQADDCDAFDSDVDEARTT